MNRYIAGGYHRYSVGGGPGGVEQVGGVPTPNSNIFPCGWCCRTYTLVENGQDRALLIQIDCLRIEIIC